MPRRFPRPLRRLVRVVAVARVVLREIGWYLRNLQAAAAAALEVLELLAPAEHHLLREMSCISLRIPANAAGARSRRQQMRSDPVTFVHRHRTSVAGDQLGSIGDRSRRDKRVVRGDNEAGIGGPHRLTRSSVSRT